MIPEIIAEFGQVFAFARARWARFAEQVHPELRGPDMLMLQMISRRGPITATELGQLLFMDKALVSRQTSKLRQLGLIDAASDETDRRVMLLTATERAKRTLGELHDQLSAEYEQRLEGWTTEDLAKLQVLLHRFNGAAQMPELDGPAARCARRNAHGAIADGRPGAG